jgi:hypothetical protein
MNSPQSNPWTDHRWRSALAILPWAFLGGVMSALSLRHGLLASEDSWGYWEGSVSILEHGSYSYFGGGPVTAFPPGLSLYLALIQTILGKTGVALIAGACLLNFCTIAIWVWFLDRLLERCGTRPQGMLRACAAAFIVLFVVADCYTLEGHLIVLPMIGVIFVVALEASGRKWPENRLGVAALALAVAAATLAHNSAVVFIPAAVVVLWPTIASTTLSEKLKAACLFGLLSGGPWLAFRLLLHQAHSHSIGHVLYGPVQLARQGFTSLGGLFLLPKPWWVLQGADFLLGVGLVGWMGWVLAARGNSEDSALKIPLRMVMVSGLCLYLVLNVVHIEGPLQGRYLTYMPLALVGPLCLWFWERRSAVAILCLCGLLLTCKSWRTGLFVSRSVVTKPWSWPAHYGALYPEYYLSSNPNASPPPGYIGVIPPTFTWMQRWQPGPHEADQRLVYQRAN